MKTGSAKKSLKIFGAIGMALCACAGGIVGFIYGGPIAAFFGIFAGIFIAQLLEKLFANIEII